MQTTNLLPKETLRALAESADAVEFGQTIDTSGGGYMDSVAATSRVVNTTRSIIQRRQQQPRSERVTFSFDGGAEVSVPAVAAVAPAGTPKKRERKVKVVQIAPPSTPPPPPPSSAKSEAAAQKEIQRRNKIIQKAAEGLISYSDVITASAASGENSRQRLKTLKLLFGGKSSGKGDVIATKSTSSIRAIDSSLEAASSITRRARVSSYSSKRKRNPSKVQVASNVLLNTKTIISTLLKEALTRYVDEDFVPEEQAASWVRRFSKIRMIYSMNMRFFAAALSWIYVSFGNKDVDATMKVDEEFARQMKDEKIRKQLIDSIILIAKPTLTEVLPSSSSSSAAAADSSSSSMATPAVTGLDRSVLLTYAVWIIYNENQAYSIDASLYEDDAVDEGEGEGEEMAAGEEDETEEA